MSAPSLTIFANFRIDNHERFKRMKDSFNSFNEISASKWVVNVRGNFKLQTIEFLNGELGSRLSSNLLESNKGWFSDTKLMLDQIDTDFILCWVEDHLNMEKISKYDEILNEMKDSNVDHLLLSWWHEPEKETYNHIDAFETENLKIYNMNVSNIKIINDGIGKSFYMVSLHSILSYSFFKKIIDNPPKFRRWPKETPFDFEKSSQKSFLLPFRTALPKSELFVNIDFDNGVEGYSLISRGLYQSAQIGDSIREIRKQKINVNKFFLRRFIPHFLYVFLGKLKIFFRRILYSLK
jgi:hypothetical protein